MTKWEGHLDITYIYREWVSRWAFVRKSSTLSSLAASLRQNESICTTAPANSEAGSLDIVFLGNHQIVTTTASWSPERSPNFVSLMLQLQAHLGAKTTSEHANPAILAAPTPLQTYCSGPCR